MAKKRKQKPTVETVPEPSRQKGFPFADWLKAQWVAEETFHKRFSLAGYLCTALMLISVMLFLRTGYTNRPQVLDSELPRKLVMDIGKTLSVYPDQDLGKMETPWDNQEYLYFKLTPGKRAGLIVPLEMINIPKGLTEIGISTGLAYMGEPVLYWGFCTKDMPLDLVRSGEISIKTEYIKNNAGLYRFTSIPTLYPVDEFPVTVDEADYFYFIFDAKEPTDLALTGLTFVGRS